MPSLVVANWKMNPKTIKEAKKLFAGIAAGSKNIKKAQMAVCPPSVFLSSLAGSSKKIKMGAQNCYWEEKGAFTGEISLAQIASLGCEYVLVGHSERRKIFGETDESANKKLLAVLALGLTPILCVGETEQEKEDGGTFEVLKVQLEKGLEKVAKKVINKIVLAYEPVWAIGTGKVCEAAQAEEVCIFIKKLICKKYGRTAANQAQILYGGSVRSDNVLRFVKDAQMSGVLVGGASLDAKEFIKIAKEIDF